MTTNSSKMTNFEVSNRRMALGLRMRRMALLSLTGCSLGPVAWLEQSMIQDQQLAMVQDE